LRVQVRPAGPFQLPRLTGADGMLRRRGGVFERLLHHVDTPVVVRVAMTAAGEVLFGAYAATGEAAAYGIERMRFALGVDQDLRPFLRRFAEDPVIGPSLRRRPWLRAGRRPQPLEALVFAISEQLIEYERAAAIQRRLVAALGRRWVGRDGIGGGLADLPTAAVLAGTAPARLQSFDLGAARALTLTRAAREVARGRVDLYGCDHERAWRRLRAIPGIGPWTVEVLALHGQGRDDQVPAGDLGLLRLVGKLLSGGDPHALAQEHEVRELFAPYGEWAGLAACHLLSEHAGKSRIGQTRAGRWMAPGSVTGETKAEPGPCEPCVAHP
jgi:3-methyladenine DNA glycosylase/8-oxoguanine DNA glycosylase